MRPNMKLLTAFFLTIAAAIPLSAAPDWLEWRGPTRDGQIHSGAKPWPNKLNKENLKKVWSKDLAHGYSSPIVSGNRIFTVETLEKKDEIVRAFERKTGEELWKSSWAGSMKVPFYASKNGSWVRCTPACDGETLYIGGMRDVLVALDVTNGQERWRSDFPKDENTTRPQFGFVSSPMLDEEFIYAQVGGALRKIRKSDGTTVWKAMQDDRSMWGEAFSSPTRAKIGGIDQILVQARMALAGISPVDGSVLWSTPVKAFRGMNILTPTPIGDQVFTASYGGGIFWFDISTREKTQIVKQLWNDTIEGNMSSPVVIDDKVYLHGRDKRVHCIDPKAQKVLWSTDKKFGDYWSTVANGNRILALDSNGILNLIEANPNEFKLIDQLKISDRPTWAHLTICGDEVIIRDLEGISLYHWK